MNSTRCDNCGAQNTSDTCPYCGSAPEAPALSAEESERAGLTGAALQGMKKLYSEGRARQALGILAQTYKQHPTLQNDAETLLLHVKLLLETDGSAGELKKLIEKAAFAQPKAADVLEYRTLIEAKEKLDANVKKPGEEALREFLKRKPNHSHALMLLGLHLFWTVGDAIEAIRYLERAVQTRPAMLRAWACLGAAYVSQKRDDAAERAFRKCVDLETNPKMLEYYKNAITQLRKR